MVLAATSGITVQVDPEFWDRSIEKPVSFGFELVSVQESVMVDEVLVPLNPVTAASGEASVVAYADADGSASTTPVPAVAIMR